MVPNHALTVKSEPLVNAELIFGDEAYVTVEHRTPAEQTTLRSAASQAFPSRPGQRCLDSECPGPRWDLESSLACKLWNLPLTTELS